MRLLLQSSFFCFVKVVFEKALNNYQSNSVFGKCMNSKRDEPNVLYDIIV